MHQKLIVLLYSYSHLRLRHFIVVVEETERERVNWRAIKREEKGKITNCALLQSFYLRALKNATLT
jgi:hypothetical protein